ncbi:hypothetical protein [Nostoc sp.]|uniref:hypothetical protein n=1 Tax=Nostoc sp. TaxID=1180 RepID=UPI002FFC5269
MGHYNNFFDRTLGFNIDEVYNFVEVKILPLFVVVMSLSTAKRFTIAEYHRLAELGFFEENNQVELIFPDLVVDLSKVFPG